MPKVSVLLTSYNHAKYIKNSIDSILSQSYKDFELYILDDCSTDNSWDIITSYHDERIKTIRNKNNVYNILEKGLFDKFKGKYFAIAHSDDVWHKDKLLEQVQFLDSHKDYAASFTDVCLIDEEGNLINNPSKSIDVFNNENRTRHQWLNHFFYKGNCLCHPSSLIRMSVQKELNLYAHGLGAIPDFYRWIKLCSKYEIYVINRKLTYFRIHNSKANDSGANLFNVNRANNELVFVFEHYFNLTDEDLIKVFPSLVQYKIENYFVKEFALSRLFLDSHIRAAKFLALKHLYLLLNDETKSKLIKDLYNYSDRDFMLETGNYDIFAHIPKSEIAHASLLSNTFEGNTDFSISKSVYVGDLKYYVGFEIGHIESSVLRFDPDEGTYRYFKNLKILSDEKEVKWWPYDSFIFKDDVLEFYTLDPKIIIELPRKAKYIKIFCDTGVIPNDKVQKYLNRYVYDKNWYARIMNKVKLYKAKRQNSNN